MNTNKGNFFLRVHACPLAVKNSSVRAAFTLIEILIVVIILGILAAIVIPQVGSASATASNNTLKEDVRFMRQEIGVFKYQHNDVSAGYPNGSASNTPDAGTFNSQMTTATDSSFNSVSTTASNALGPYLSSMPLNPVNGLSTVLVIGNGTTLPTAADGLYGWVYQPSTLTFKADAVGTDQNGVNFFSY